MLSGQCGCSENSFCSAHHPLTQLKRLSYGRQLLYGGSETELGSYLPGFESLLHHLALCPGQVTHVPEPPFPHRWKRDVVIHLVTTGESRNIPDLGFLIFTTRSEGMRVEGPLEQGDAKRHYHSRVRNGLLLLYLKRSFKEHKYVSAWVTSAGQCVERPLGCTLHTPSPNSAPAPPQPATLEKLCRPNIPGEKN